VQFEPSHSFESRYGFCSRKRANGYIDAYGSIVERIAPEEVEIDQEIEELEREIEELER
jgi:hypothetical protein